MKNDESKKAATNKTENVFVFEDKHKIKKIRRMEKKYIYKRNTRKRKNWKKIFS